MDFPSSLRPTLFMTGPLGLSDVPDMSFMCSWRDALTLPESLPQTSQNGTPHSPKGLFWEPDTPGPLPLLPPGPGKGFGPGGPLPSCSPIASLLHPSLLHPSLRPSLSLLMPSTPRVLGYLQLPGIHCPTSGSLLVPGTDSFPSRTHPSDRWDPGLTAQDLLFRGGPKFRRQPKAVLDVTEQFSRFLWDHGDIAFAPLGKLMLENFKLEGARSYSKKKTVVSVKRILQDLGGHQPWGCPWAYFSHRQRRFSILGDPILGKSVSNLLGELLHEELMMRWEQLLLDDAFTGGALAWLPGRTPRVRQLVYPAGGALDRLPRGPDFQEVRLTPGGDPRTLGKPGHIQLRGPVRQVVTCTVQGESLLAVRSDYHCALWKVSKQGQPSPLQVLQVEKGATGINLSPHLPGELVVCSRSGAVCLWTPQDGLQQIYKDPETLVFRDPSPWRWADFTAHPRVLTVGDRTGVKIIDTQGPPGCGLLLFRAGAEASCQKGERVLLTQYLGECGPDSLQPTLHLICTQFSLYLVDERLPLVPMLKWDHDLPSAPLLAQLLPPPRPGCPRPLLLGGHGGQLQLLHITGEGASMPRLAGPPQSLPSRSDSLSAFPLLEPKSQQRLQERLQAPTIGLVATVPPSASTPVLSLFQLSAAGDVFHQRLHLREDSQSPGDPGPNFHAPTASWSPHATSCCRRWLKALLEVPPAPPVWAAPTFSHRHLLGFKEQQKVEGKVPEGLRAAMAEGRLLQQRDLGSLPMAEPPPAPEPGPKDELSERLEAAWEGRAAAWWEQQQGRGSGPGKQPKRHKRRMQLSSTFSSLSGRLDLSDATSPPHSPDRTSPVSRPPLPGTLPSQELTQDLWAWGIPSERQQTLRDYMAKLPLQGDTPEGASVPPSQTSSIQATPSGQHTPWDCTVELPRRRDTPRGATVPPSQTSSIWTTACRQQASQDCAAKLSLQRDTPGVAATPSSQTSSLLTTRSGQQVPVLSGSQPRRKKPRMGF